MPRRPILLLCLLSAALVSCRTWPAASPPIAGERTVVHGPLVFRADFSLPADHRLFDELLDLRGRVYRDLALPMADETIQIRLFATEPAYRAHLRRHYPEVADRRAFFVRTDEALSVYAWWGEHLPEDLRHEVTHGYLHAVVPEIPLWLDEGLAEYYELPAGRAGRHPVHLELLLAELRDGRWHPNLVRLEQLSSIEAMQQAEYAEAWLWTHFLLHSTPDRRK